MNALQYPEKDGVVWAEFLKRCSEKPAKRIVELGTKRWGPGSTHHKHLFPDAESYVLSDVDQGQDVDVVANAHDLCSAFGRGKVNVIIACSVWEHLEKPWLAADSVHNCLAPGGMFFVQTHLCFPEHGYPNDFFRFTTEGLKSLFYWAEEVVCEYDFPATLTPASDLVEWNPAAPVFLNVNITGKKPG